MSLTERLAQKYKNVFSLPSRNYLLFGFIVFGILIGSVAYGIIGMPREFFGLVDGFFSLSIASILSALLIRVNIREGFLTFRRIIGLTFFELFILGLILIVGAGISRVFNDSLIIEKIYFISCGALTALSAIIIGSTAQLKIPRLFMAGISQPSLIILFHLILLYVFGFLDGLNIYSFLVIFLLMSTLSFLVAVWYIISIEKVGKEILGYSTFTLFRAFIEAIMLDKTGLLEKLLKMIAVVGKTEIMIFNFEGKTVKGKIVAPLVHPGPFREFGSSKLPTKLALKLKEAGINPLIFHTPTTHEKDLIFSKECDLIINSVLSSRIISKGSGVTRSVSKKKGDVTVMCQILDNVPLVVITRSPIPTEDLPERINDICLKKLAEMGFSDGVIVDAHNVMDEQYKEFGKKDEEDLLEALQECIEELKREPTSKGLVGFSNSKIDGYSLSEGFGDAGIMVMIIEVNGQKTVYVVFDGNNMIVGLREKLLENLKKEGYPNSEIATTDTHVVVARKAREGYSPIGKIVNWDIIIKKVVELVREADSKKEECLVKFSKISLEGLHFLGDQGIEKLWFVADKSIRKAKERAVIVCLALLIIGALVYLFGV
ncbi:MAG: DUF2070 family protein [Candidatus Methanomethyliaceae archaeon]